MGSSYKLWAVELRRNPVCVPKEKLVDPAFRSAGDLPAPHYPQDPFFPAFQNLVGCAPFLSLPGRKRGLGRAGADSEETSLRGWFNAFKLYFTYYFFKMT